MTKQIINVGTAANDKKGDSLRAAFQKVNANFTELYTELGLNADGTLNLGAFEFVGSTMSTTDSTAIVIDQAVTISSNLTVGGDVLPSVANGGDLGSSTRPWRSLYVSNNTIFLGGVPLSLNPGTDELNINNIPISQRITYADIPGAPTDVSDLTDVDGLLGGGGGLSITDFGRGFVDNLDAGKITTSKLYNENPNPGLNNQYTLEVTNGGVVALPDGSIINGATLKTIAGNYAGITAGPASPAGRDEDSWVWVDNDGATIATKYSTDAHTWTFNNSGALTFPQGTTIATADGTDAFLIDGAVDKDVQIYTYSGPTPTAHGWTFGADGSLTLPDQGPILFGGNNCQIQAQQGFNISSDGGIVVAVNGEQWQFAPDGSITFPDNTVQTTAYTGVVRQDTAPTADNGTLWFNTQEGRLYIKYSDVWVDAAPLVQPLPDTDIDVNSITFPDATILTSAYTNKLVSGINEVVIDADGMLTLPAAVGTLPNLFHSLGVSIGAGIAGDTTWSFNADGSLTFPDGETFGSGILKSAPGNNSIGLTDATGINFIRVATGMALITTNNEEHTWQFDTDGDLTIPGTIRSEGNIDIEVNLTDSTLRKWQFGEDGNLTLPVGGDILDINGNSLLNNSDDNIWIQEFETSLGADDVPALAMSVEYLANGDVVALFIHDSVEGLGSTGYNSVARFNPNGTRVWSMRFTGDTQYTNGWGLAVSSGYIYVAGSASELGYDVATLTKLDDEDGGIIWSKAYDVGYENLNTVVDVASDGNPVVVGYAANGTDNQIVTSKINADDGSVIWSKALNGQGNEEAYGMAVGPTGEVVSVGYMAQLGEDTDDQMLVVRYLSDGTIDWQKSVTVEEGFDCKGSDADIDSEGNIYVCGNFESDGFGGAGQAMILIKFNSSGVKQWTRKLIGDCLDFSNSIVVGSDDYLYLSAVTVAAETTNMVIAKYNTDGGVEWQRLLNNTAAAVFAGTIYIEFGGGSNLAVRNGYVTVCGAFGDLANFPEILPNAIVAQFDSAGTIFAVGNYEFTSAGFSGTLDADASDITVVDAAKTPSDYILEFTITDFDPVIDLTSDLIGTLYYSGVGGGDNRLVNGANQLTLESNGAVTLPQGGTISEGYVTSNPTIQLTPASPDVASQKLVIKGGATGSATTQNGITVFVPSGTWTQGNVDYVYVESLANAGQTLYWWIYPEGAGLTVPSSGTVTLNGAGSGTFTFTLVSDDYEFTVRVSPEDNNYGPVTGVESILINSNAPTFASPYHLHLTTGDLTETSIFLGTDDHNVRTTTNGNIQITTPNATNKVWEFDTTGALTIPGNIRSEGNIDIEVNLTDSTLRRWQFGEDGDLTFPNGVLKIAGNTISNYVVGDPGSSGSQLEVAPTKTVITNGVTNSLGEGGPSLISQSLFEVSTNGILSSFQVINTLGEGDPSLTSEYLTELDNLSFKIGQRVTNDLGDGSEPLVAFNGWTFGTVGQSQALTFPDGTTQTTAAQAFSFSVAGDDSTQRVINNNESIKFIGAGKINTASDAEGNITITGADSEGSWTVTAGTNTYSFTVPADGTYTLWVKGNIPNGIITWNATLSITNTNVPAIGYQYAWNYTGGGSPILLTAIPDQIRGSAGTISTDATYAGSTSNRFDFTIANSSGSAQTVYYGYTKV